MAYSTLSIAKYDSIKTICIQISIVVLISVNIHFFIAVSHIKQLTYVGLFVCLSVIWAPQELSIPIKLIRQSLIFTWLKIKLPSIWYICKEEPRILGPGGQTQSSDLVHGRYRFLWAEKVYFAKCVMVP